MALTPRLRVRMPAPALRGAGGIGVDINANWLDPVRFVATSGTLSAIDAGQVIDGVTVVAGNSFLFQPVTAGVAATGATHGIYVAGADGVAPTRRADADTGAEIYHAAVVVQEGTVGAGQQWICVTEPAPAVGTDGITFRLMGTGGGGGGGGGDVADVMLPASANFATYSDAADLVATAGYNVYSDAGGMSWKRGTTTMPSTLTYFRKQDFGGVWYEAVSKRTIMGESIGIFGAGTGTDVGPNINEAIAWLGGKGGGRLVLPPGICNSDVDLLCDTDGIWIQGTAPGAANNDTGTVLRLAATRSFHLGAAGGTERYAFKCSDMKVTQDAATATYFFRSHKFREIRLSHLQVQGCNGFLNAGDQITSSFSKMIFMDNIEGNITGAGHFILGTNLGAFFLTGVRVEGATVPPAGQAFLFIPNNNDSPLGFVQNVVDGAIITGCGASRWDYGIRVAWGIGNFFVTNSWFDRCSTSSLWITTAGGVNAARFNNCHFVGTTPSNPDAVGINLSENGSTINRFEISDSQICHWGKSAMRLGEDPPSSPKHVSILNNQFEDNCHELTDGTGSVILIGGTTWKCKVSGNQIYKESNAPAFVNKPKYGINITTTSPLLEVIDNQIFDIHSSGATINNPNRGPAGTRKIHNNTGQVLEGQVVNFGPWAATGLTATASVDLTLADLPALEDATVMRRGQVLSITARANNPVSGGSITFYVTKNGVNTTLSATTTSFAQAYAEDLAGLDFVAGDELGVRMTTSAAAPTTLNWVVFINIIYD